MGSPERIRAIAKRTRRLVDSGYARLAIVVSAMSGETNRLVALVSEVNASASPKSYDMTVAAGEQVSVGLLAAALEGEGLVAEPLLGYQLGVETDGEHAKARIQRIQTDRIFRAWDEKRVPVIAGFQGVTPSQEITTLGRGGSDTSAVALAVALGAGFCEINTDVSGVFTADPRLVKTASLIEKMDYETAMELALLGGKVLHVRSVELAAKYLMPLTVRSTFEADDARRTRIMKLSAQETLEAPIVSGVTQEKQVAKITLAKKTGRSTEVFQALASAGINVDIIVYDRRATSSEVGFTISETDLPTASGVLSAFADGEVSWKSETGLAKVSVVGLGMQTHSGVASRAFEALAVAGVEIFMISTSEIKISCVVLQGDMEKAVAAWHAEFFAA